MRYLTALLLIPALILVISASSKSEFNEPVYASVEVQVTAGLDPLPGASVALDLNNNGEWDEGEPLEWTDGAGIAYFADIVSIQDPGGGESDVRVDWQPTRIMMGNLRGAVGASDVQLDFVLPAGSGTARLGLYDLRGRRLGQTHGTGDLALTMPSGLPSGVYFLRLSAEPAAPVSQRITSVGVRTQTVRATRVSAVEAVAAGWVDDRPAGQEKKVKTEDPPHHINLIVAHADYPTVVQPRIIEPGWNSFFVSVQPGTVMVEPGGSGEIEITDPDDPLYGLIVVIPEGAVNEPTLFEVAYVSDPPATEFPGFVPIGLVVDVTSSYPGSFEVPIEISLPVSGPGDDSLLLGTYFDDALGDWLPLPSQLSENGTVVTIFTSHLSYFGIHTIEITPEMEEAVGEIAGLIALLHSSYYEVNGARNCLALASLRTAMAEIADQSADLLNEWNDAHEWCRVTLCAPLFDEYDSIGQWLVEYIPNVIRDATFNAMAAAVQATQVATVSSIVLFAIKFILLAATAYGIAIFGSCAICALATSGASPPVIVAWLAFTLGTAGVGLIDKAIDEYGCNDPAPPPGFVYIPPGTFMMGSPDDEPGRFADRETQHPVTLTQGFYMSRYEVTEEWWYQVMGGTPTTSQLPKSHVSWDMAVQFCNTLSLQEGLTPAYTIHGTNGNVTWHQGTNGYRLPTEAEWEYACRATTTMAYHNDTNCLHSTTEANFRGNTSQLPGCSLGIYRGARTEVGSFPANQWGLYDMHGNLWEWVWDGYRADYENLPSVDPVHNVEPGADRVFRGGGWYDFAQGCRSAGRNGSYPGFESDAVGFRPVRSAN